MIVLPKGIKTALFPLLWKANMIARLLGLAMGEIFFTRCRVFTIIWLFWQRPFRDTEKLYLLILFLLFFWVWKLLLYCFFHASFCCPNVNVQAFFMSDFLWQVVEQVVTNYCIFKESALRLILLVSRDIRVFVYMSPPSVFF